MKKPTPSPATPRDAELPPVTRRLLGILRGARLDRADYVSYLEHKYR